MAVDTDLAAGRGLWTLAVDGWAASRSPQGRRICYNRAGRTVLILVRVGPGPVKERKTRMVRCGVIGRSVDNAVCVMSPNEPGADSTLSTLRRTQTRTATQPTGSLTSTGRTGDATMGEKTESRHSGLVAAEERGRDARVSRRVGSARRLVATTGGGEGWWVNAGEYNRKQDSRSSAHRRMVSAGQSRPEQVSGCWARSRRRRQGQVRPGQARSGQVKSSQIRFRSGRRRGQRRQDPGDGFGILDPLHTSWTSCAGLGRILPPASVFF